MMSHSKNVGDVVMALQKAKFGSQNWRRPGVSYRVDVFLTATPDGIPLTTVVSVDELVGDEESLQHISKWHTSDIPVDDVLDAVSLIYPDWRPDKELLSYV